jgi:uncharacterized Tic20 family protein
MHPAQPRPETAADRRTREALIAEGFTPEEAAQALLDEAAARGAAPLAPGPYAAAVPTGTLAWGLGLLAYLPVPLLSLVVAGVAMACAYPSQRRRSPVAAENARRAANWGLTVVLVCLVMVGAVVVLALALGPTPGSRVLLPLVLIFPLGLTHLVLVVRGMVRAGRGQVLETRLAIPFLRG